MDIYQHFRKSEQPFIDQVLAWKEQVERSFQPKLTDFLDPRERQIIEMIIGPNNTDLILHSNGGGVHTERKRMIIAPFYEAMDPDDFELALLEAMYQDKFVALSHPDVMGAFLSLGIKRKKLGDIYAANGVVQIIVSKDIAPYVTANLTSIKKAKIKLEEKPLENLLIEEETWINSDHTVSSLRLDVIVKEIYRLSRKEAAELITKSLVKVNYKVVEDAKFPLQEGDLLSVRGKGRSKLKQINGQTKKEKYKITTAVLK